jgi:hypothetical protein
MNLYHQMSAQERATAHINLIKKASYQMTSDRYRRMKEAELRASLRSDICAEDSLTDDAARTAAIQNCYAAVDDYRKAGDEDRARLYELRARILCPGEDPSCVKEYFDLLQRVRGGEKASSHVSSAFPVAGKVIMTSFAIILMALTAPAFPSVLPILAAVIAGVGILMFTVRQTFFPRRTDSCGRPVHPFVRIARANAAILVFLGSSIAIWVMRSRLLALTVDVGDLSRAAQTDPAASLARLKFVAVLGLLLLGILWNCYHLAYGFRDWRLLLRDRQSGYRRGVISFIARVITGGPCLMSVLLFQGYVIIAVGAFCSKLPHVALLIAIIGLPSLIWFGKLTRIMDDD